MSIDSKYLNMFRKSVEMGAIGASKFIGKNDKIAADQSAVNFMRKELNKIEMRGKIVIGEGEMDEAPMLYIGEELGSGNGQNLDIAVDPLECTNFVAKNLPNSFSVLAVTEKGKHVFRSRYIHGKNCNRKKSTIKTSRFGFLRKKKYPKSR